MQTISINRATGAVGLPDGTRITPSLAQEDFRQGNLFRTAGVRPGAGTWMNYTFPGGSVDGHDLIVILRFDAEKLTSVTLSLDFYPPGPKDWSSYSLDVEAQAKEHYDALLTEILGPPTEAIHLAGMSLAPAHAALSRPLAWHYPWGTVRSAHDSKGGGTYIAVSYSGGGQDGCRTVQ